MKISGGSIAWFVPSSTVAGIIQLTRSWNPEKNSFDRVIVTILSGSLFDSSDKPAVDKPAATTA